MGLRQTTDHAKNFTPHAFAPATRTSYYAYRRPSTQIHRHVQAPDRLPLDLFAPLAGIKPRTSLQPSQPNGRRHVRCPDLKSTGSSPLPARGLCSGTARARSGYTSPIALATPIPLLSALTTSLLERRMRGDNHATPTPSPTSPSTAQQRSYSLLLSSLLWLSLPPV